MEPEERGPGEEFRDEEYPDGDGEGDRTSACPQCGASMYADAARCPHCGDYVTPGSAIRRGWPWWMWLCMALTGLVLLGWVLGR